MTTLSTYLDDPIEYTYPVETVTWADTITATSGDVVEAISVKSGWKIINVKLGYTGTASSTATVGDGSDADRFIASASTATSGTLSAQREPTLSGSDVATGPGYIYTADDTIDITIGGADVSAKVYSLVVTFVRTF